MVFFFQPFHQIGYWLVEVEFAAQSDTFSLSSGIASADSFFIAIQLIIVTIDLSSENHPIKALMMVAVRFKPISYKQF